MGNSHAFSHAFVARVAGAGAGQVMLGRAAANPLAGRVQPEGSLRGSTSRRGETHTRWPMAGGAGGCLLRVVTAALGGPGRGC